MEPLSVITTDSYFNFGRNVKRKIRKCSTYKWAINDFCMTYVPYVYFCQMNGPKMAAFLITLASNVSFMNLINEVGAVRLPFLIIFETAGPHVHLEYIIACSSMFFHSSSNELRTKLLVWFWIGIMGCSLSRFKVQALTHWHMGTAATLLLEWNTFEAKVLRKHLRFKCISFKQ